MKIFFSGVLVFLFLVPLSAHADVRINEVFPNPDGSDDGAEFVELFNDSAAVVDLSGWRLEDGSGRSDFVFDDGVELDAEEYLTFYKKDDFDFSLNNSGEESVVLKDAEDEVVFEIAYVDAPEEQSWNFGEEGWYWSAEPSPEDANTPPEEIIELEILDDYPALTLSELLPNPEGDESTEEFIEIFNPHDESVPLWGWVLADSGRSGGFVFGEEDLIAPGEYLAVPRTEFDFALNNSGSETVSLTAPNGAVTSSVAYETAQEGAALAWTGERWRWTPHVTPGEANVFPEETDIDLDVPKKVFVNESATFSAKVNTRDDISVRWDFGDGSRSYKEIATHTFKDTGTFDGALTVTTPHEKIIKEFSVKVKKYPEHEISITALMPNPAGADTGQEWITVASGEKKKVNLAGWQIAVGAVATNLTARTITQESELAPGATIKLTRAHAAFTLPNTRGTVELRRPDGSVASTVSYEKEGGIKDNEEFRWNGKSWQWHTAEQNQSENVDAKTAELVARAIANDRERAAQSDDQTHDVFTEADIVVPRKWYDPVLDFFASLAAKASRLPFFS